MATKAEVEAAGRAICAADDSMYHHERTDDMPCSTCLGVAAVALAAVEPLLRERLVQGVEAELRKRDDGYYIHSIKYRDGMAHAVRIIRGDASSTCPTCDGDDPLKHPVVGGEVQMCRDSWHTPRDLTTGRLLS